MAGLLAAGDTLHGRYTIEAVLRTGRQGAIYLGRDAQGAAKAVLIREGSDPSPEAQDAFQREVQTLSALEHPSLPVIIDHFVEPSGRQYLVSEKVEGPSAADMVNRSGPLAEADLLAWFDRVLAAVEYLHAQRPPIIHGGISPSSIILTERGTPHLVDLAGVDDGEIAGGSLTGNPYVPPEQHLGRADERSDIYALGATLYMLLTGAQPPSPLARAGGQELTPPRQLNGAVSAALEAMILKAMALEPQQRFATPSEMWQALQKRSPRPKRPVPKVLPVAAGVMGAALAAVVLWRVMVGLIGPGRQPRAAGPAETAQPRPTPTTQTAAVITLMPATPMPLVADTVVPTQESGGATATLEPSQELEGTVATLEPTHEPAGTATTATATAGATATTVATARVTTVPPTIPPTVKPAATASVAPRPTRVATPTEGPRRFPAPAPLSPAADSSVSGEVQFSWYWPEAMAPDERFDLQVYRPGATPAGIAWCTETSYRTSQLPAGQGDYLWRVQVVKVSGGQVVGYVTEPSVEVPFTWHSGG